MTDEKRTPSGLILPDAGLDLPVGVVIERLQAEIVRLRAFAGALARELERLRRQAGEAPELPLPARRERRAAERVAKKAKKADRKGGASEAPL